MNFNKVFLVGEVSRDIEVRKTKGGYSVGEFRLTTLHTKKNGEKDACPVDVTVWGDQADALEDKLFKGLIVQLDGRLSFNSYESKDGETKSKHQIIASKGEKVDTGSPAAAQQEEALQEEDIPF